MLILTRSPHNILNWGTTEEGQILLGELGIREAVLEPPFTESARPVFTEELKKKLLQHGPRGWSGAVVALLSPLVGQDLYAVGRRL